MITTATKPERSTGRKDFLHAMFTTALEGGIGYWSACSEYHWSKPGLTPSGANDFVNDVNGFYATLVSVEEEDWAEDLGADTLVYQPSSQLANKDGMIKLGFNDEKCPELRVDIDVMERGVNLLVDNVIAAAKSEDEAAPFNRKYLRQFVIQWLTDLEDGDSDADVADLVVQLGLFGEVVYA